jgi:coenzyme F420-reducing hydrogenase delta subunit
MAETFEPEILALCCNYCSYAAADLAGSMRLEYPDNVKIIRMPCTGRLDQSFILKALEKGIDGVYVAGCLEGNCHFETGNFFARKRVTHLKRILETIGINPERIEMYNMSAAMGARFAEVAREFTERIRALGPSPVKRKKGREIGTRSAEKAKEASPGV